MIKYLYKAVLAALIIVFAWWNVPWGKWVLTAIGALLLIWALSMSSKCGSGSFSKPVIAKPVIKPVAKPVVKKKVAKKKK